MAAIFIAVYRKATDGQSKVSFHFESCLLVSTALNRSSVSLAEPDSSSARVFVNIVTAAKFNYTLSAKYEHAQLKPL